MANHNWQIVQKILNILRAETIMVQHQVMIVTHMPKHSQFPLIYIGKVVSSDASSKTHQAQRIHIMVHVICRGQEREIAETLLNACHIALERHGMHVNNTTLQQKEDGITYHAALEINIIRSNYHV